MKRKIKTEAATGAANDFTARVISRKWIRKGVERVVERRELSVYRIGSLIQDRLTNQRRFAKKVCGKTMHPTQSWKYDSDRQVYFCRGGEATIAEARKALSELSWATDLAINPADGRAYYTRTGDLDHLVLAPFFSIPAKG